MVFILKKEDVQPKMFLNVSHCKRTVSFEKRSWDVTWFTQKSTRFYHRAKVYVNLGIIQTTGKSDYTQELHETFKDFFTDPKSVNR